MTRSARRLFFTLPFIASVFPYVASGPSGFDASTQLAYGQLLAAFVAVSLAGASGSWQSSSSSLAASLSSRDSRLRMRSG